METSSRQSPTTSLSSRPSSMASGKDSIYSPMDGPRIQI
ncbi:hypothetical protein EYF80_067647 [Liparis tanakae]|uniref:Uncharacterized protein n=1 Tax=Liparis tanakae TaxID=230148 RepID=A0A4Z2E0I4_9TELE|nr:hypothetical protein EYF80_067647 [Liparis tanakae]